MSLSKWMTDAQKGIPKWLTSMPGVSRWLIYSGVAAGMGILTGTGYLYTNPDILLYWYDRYMLRSAGFTVKYVQGKQYTYCYAERGQLRSDQASLIFLDKFDGGKESWMEVCKKLPEDLHIICVELPGQGESTVPTDVSQASLFAMVELLNEFSCLLDLEVVPHHIVGLSVGGSVAGLYAATYAQRVCRLTLMAPLMQCPIETDFWPVSENYDIQPYLANDPEQLKAIMEKSFYNQDSAPQALWVYRALLKRIRTKKEFLRQLYANLNKEITGESSKYENLLSTIKCPVQVIWGEDDQIVHVSGASLLEEVISTVHQTSILSNCGHAIYSDRTDTVGKLIADFYYSI